MRVDKLQSKLMNVNDVRSIKFKANEPQYNRHRRLAIMSNEKEYSGVQGIKWVVDTGGWSNRDRS